MNADIFARWLECQGHRVVRTESSYWFDQGPRVFQAFPYHWVIQPDETELINICKKEKAIGLRYSTSIESSEGCLSYHAVYERKAYGFEDLGKWARKNVRRGISACQVEPISFERLADEGYALQRDTLDRQGRRLGLDNRYWRRMCLSAADLPGFEAWGALVEGKLAASVISFQMDDYGYLLYQQCHRDYLAYHVNNALGFIVTRNLIQRPGIKGILYGLHSLDAPPSVDEFKFRMGYLAKPVRQRVIFHPLFQPLVNPFSHTLLRTMRRLSPGSPVLAKAEGLFRFHLQGRLPLSRQALPEPLRETPSPLPGLNR